MSENEIDTRVVALLNIFAFPRPTRYEFPEDYDELREAGIYFFFNRTRMAFDYIGQSVDVGKRIRSHLYSSEGKYQRDIHAVYVVFTPRTNQIKREAIEAALIALCTPRFNIKWRVR